MYAKTVAAVALALCASSAVAQTNYSDVDIGALDIGLKTSWCNAQFDTCNTLCGNPTQNGCDDSTLSYQCTCANGSAPGLQYYIQTIPTFLCEQSYQQCIAANTMNASGQAVCNANEKADCGQLTPGGTPSSGSSSSGSSPSSTADSSAATNAASNTGSNTAAASNTGSQTSSGVASSTSAGAAATMLALGREFGSGVIAAGVAVAVML